MSYFAIGIRYDPPCGHCQPDDGRKVGCHATCERYIEYKKERARLKELKEKDNFNKMWKRY